jgi:hypothetical protein
VFYTCNHIVSNAKFRYDNKKLQYYGLALTRVVKLDRSFVAANVTVARENVPKFSAYQEEYAGRHPSGISIIKCAINQSAKVLSSLGKIFTFRPHSNLKGVYMDFEALRLNNTCT